uniref:Myomesin 3 n=1 Tax=Astyanax mexicanus TaxID=7994 RepID=A0A8B9HJK6_ASTMX
MTVQSTRFAAFDLQKGKSYCFRVRSINKYGISDPSEPSVPAAPHCIQAVADTDSSAVLLWKEPKNTEGILGYYLYCSEVGTSNWRTINNKPVNGTRSDTLQTLQSYRMSLRSTLSFMFFWIQSGLAPEHPFQTVSALLEGHYYQFRLFASNMIGLSKPSQPSEAFLCEPWTMPEPGCPYDLELREVRRESLVVMWAEPLYQGQSQITGYVVEISQGEESEDWTEVTQESVTDRHLKVSGPLLLKTYRLRVSAVNSAGVGRPSLPTEPITAQTKPGTKDMEIGVDNDGFIFLSFQASETAEDGQFKWNKNYREAIDAGRAHLETKHKTSVLTFTAASEEDLGLYTAEMMDSPDVSSSYNFTAEGKIHRLSVIALRSEGWQVEVSDQGAVRLWLQTEPLSSSADLRMILNDREITSTPARKINFDKPNGLVEILFDQLSKEDEGSYTAQLKDGRAKNQFTLVLVDEKFIICDFPERLSNIFSQYLKTVTRKEAGVYRAVVSDSRGEDESILELSLCLTCFADGDPAPEMFWLKNDREITSTGQYHIAHENKCTTITISSVTMEDSGNYSIFVRNSYGSQTVHVTVSVYKHGEKPRAGAVEM